MDRDLFALEIETVCDYALAARRNLAEAREMSPYAKDRRMNDKLNEVAGALEDLVIQAVRLREHTQHEKAV